MIQNNSNTYKFQLDWLINMMKQAV